jgi:hypothetical protein
MRKITTTPRNFMSSSKTGAVRAAPHSLSNAAPMSFWMISPQAVLIVAAR